MAVRRFMFWKLVDVQMWMNVLETVNYTHYTHSRVPCLHRGSLADLWAFYPHGERGTVTCK